MKKGKARLGAEAEARWKARLKTRLDFIGPMKPLRVVEGPTNNRELIALNVLARDPVTEVYVKRIPPGNPRKVGRNRMEREVNGAFERLRISGALRPAYKNGERNYVWDTETANMRVHLDEIANIVDETIADDDKAGLLMRTIGYAFGSMHGLGGMEGSHEPESELRARREKRRIPGLITGAENKADAEERHQFMKDVWRANRSEFSGRKLAKKICAGDFGHPPDLSEERVRALISKWEKAGLPASS
jgi:hypothetical protein